MDAEVPEVPAVTEKSYEQLFALSHWMLSARPWERMADFNCFVLIDPDTGDEQIAAVMGKAGNFFALHLYQPEEGTRWLTELHLVGPEEPHCRHNAQYDQRLLEVEFTDGSELDPHDVDLMERFGALLADAPSRRSGPHLTSVVLRSVHPGCPPWHPEQAEVTRLIDGLRLLRRFYEEHLAEFEWAVFAPDENGAVSLPTFRLPEGGRRDDPTAWELALEPFQGPPPKQLPEIPADDLFVARLGGVQVKPGTRWEQGAVFAPNPMIDEGRPVYPVVGLIGAQETGRVEGLEVSSSRTARAILFRRSFSKAVDDLGYLPEELVVGTPIAELALAELAKQAGIRLVPGDRGMPLFEHIAQDLLSSPLFRPADEDEGDLPFNLDELPPDALRDLERLVRDAPKAGADEAEVAAFFSKVMENEAGGAFLQHLAGSTAPEGPLGQITELPGPAESGGAQQILSVPEPVDADRYVMRIDLVGMKPPIWRRLSLPAEATFRELHRAIQAAFDWEDAHLHEFQLRHGHRLVLTVGVEDTNWHEDTTKLKQIFTTNIDKLHYVYDFGDNWTHLIKIEKKVPAASGETGPLCHAGRGIAPLEDCGGIWGYRQLLDGTSEFCEEFDEETLRHHREGKFSPKEVRF